MGGPPPPHSSPSLPHFLSSKDDWYLTSSDRDTQILTQALSICSRGSAPACSSSSSQFPSPASGPSSSPLHEVLSLCLDGTPSPCTSLFALQQQQRQVKHLQQQQQKALAFSSMGPGGDQCLHSEQNFQQRGSSMSYNSSGSSPPLSASGEAPASPFSSSTLSTNTAMSTEPTEGFLPHSKSNNRQHQDSLDVRTVCNSSRPSKSALRGLSSQVSVGAGGCKVNKRRNRIKSPIAVLSADASNFRAMVQQLTGIPSASSMQSHGGIPLLKPQPGHPFTNTENLPLLDTSACFLGPKISEGFSYMQRTCQKSSELPANVHAYAAADLLRGEGHKVDRVSSTLQSHMPQHVSQSVFGDQANGMNQRFSSTLPSMRRDSVDSLKGRGNFSSLREGEQVFMKQSALAATPTMLDSLLMEELSAPNLPMSAWDSWFSLSDSAHANNLEVARMA